MKKVILMGAIALIALGFTSCKSKQANYKSAYETAKEKPVEPVTPVASQTDTNKPVVTQPTETSKPAVSSKPTTNEPITTRVEKVTSNDGTLQKYSVVIGSFINKTNADAEKARMTKEGYSVMIAQNEEGRYRVIIATFPEKEQAAEKRDQIKAKYKPQFADAWILEKQ